MNKTDLILKIKMAESVEDIKVVLLEMVKERVEMVRCDHAFFKKGCAECPHSQLHIAHAPHENISDADDWCYNKGHCFGAEVICKPI